MKSLILVIAGLGLGLQAYGEGFEGSGVINPLPNNQTAMVARVVVPAGFWFISGQVDLYMKGAAGAVYGAAGISLNMNDDLLRDPKALTHATQRAQSQVGLVFPFSPAGQFIKVNSSTPVYIVVYSNQPQTGTPTALAWGFITAVRVGFPP